MALKNFDEFLTQQLKDRDMLNAFLAENMQQYQADGDQSGFLHCLEIAAKAQGSIEQLAEKTGMTRQALYRIFSNKGNPTLSSLVQILNALGYKLTVTR